jgi:hypothetical protein
VDIQQTLRVMAGVGEIPGRAIACKVLAGGGTEVFLGLLNQRERKEGRKGRVAELSGPRV